MLTNREILKKHWDDISEEERSLALEHAEYLLSRGYREGDALEQAMAIAFSKTLKKAAK